MKQIKDIFKQHKNAFLAQDIVAKSEFTKAIDRIEKEVLKYLENKEKSFTQEQVFDLLLSMQQGISPRMFGGDSQHLDSFDFLDLPLSKANNLGVKKEFVEWANNQENLIEKY